MSAKIARGYERCESVANEVIRFPVSALTIVYPMPKNMIVIATPHNVTMISSCCCYLPLGAGLLLGQGQLPLGCSQRVRMRTLERMGGSVL